jgi:hypothetical protein
LLGRAFSAEENVPGRNQVVILTNGFWKSRMGADSNAIGKVLRLNGDPYVIVGVLPSGFSFDYPNLRIAEPAEIYVPLPLEDTLTSGVTRGQSSIADQVRVFGRIRGDATHDQAATELAGIARELFPPENRIPGQTGDRFFQAQPLREAIVGNQRSVLWLLMGGIAVLLLIACANTAQLLLARSLSRGREVAIRAALWARRGCD